MGHPFVTMTVCIFTQSDINGGASFRWSFGPLSAWGSMEPTTIYTTRPSLYSYFYIFAEKDKFCVVQYHCFQSILWFQLEILVQLTDWLIFSEILRYLASNNLKYMLRSIHFFAEKSETNHGCNTAAVYHKKARYIDLYTRIYWRRIYISKWKHKNAIFQGNGIWKC